MRTHLACLGLKILHPLFFFRVEVRSNSNLKACWYSTITSQQEGYGFIPQCVCILCCVCSSRSGFSNQKHTDSVRKKIVAT